MVDARSHDQDLLPGGTGRRRGDDPVPGPAGGLLVSAGLLEDGPLSLSAGYVELHIKSFYSFGTGASHVHELLAQAVGHGYKALALTDANLCDALEFARLAGSLGIRPITGGELTLTDGSRIVLLARTRQGYANISRLFTLSNAADRREPRLDPAYLPEHAGGVTLLTGGRDGPLSRLLTEGRREDAGRLLHAYREWYGPDGVYVELQQIIVLNRSGCTGILLMGFGPCKVLVGWAPSACRVWSTLVVVALIGPSSPV